MRAFGVNRKNLFSTKFKGRFFESLAFLYYIVRGYKPLARNLHTPIGEVDLLFVRRKTLYLVEVKFRKSELFSLSAVHPKQKERLLKQAHYLGAQYNMDDIVLEGIFFFLTPPFVRVFPLI